MNKKRKQFFWILLILLAFSLVVITFTPLILNPGKVNPKLFHLPYTLWISILITVILVILTYLGSRVRDDE